MSVESARSRPSLTSRERELLAVAAELLAEHGFQGLTVEQVATRARASKATVYRRWPSKASLVVAAAEAQMPPPAPAPDLGSLRAELLVLAERAQTELREHGDLLAVMLPELRRIPELRHSVAAFLDRRREVLHEVLERAVRRGEITEGWPADLWDVQFGYLTYRYLMPGRELGTAVAVELVDRVLLPSLQAGPRS